MDPIAALKKALAEKEAEILAKEQAAESEKLQSELEKEDEKKYTSDSSSEEQSEVEFSDSDDSDASETPESHEIKPRELEFDEEETMVDGELRTKNELELPQVEPLNIEIAPDTPITQIGVAHSIVDRFLTIQATVSGDVKVLDVDTVIVLSNRTPVGKIFDVFGPVTKPLYSILFNSKQDIDSLNIEIGQEMYFVPDLANIIYTEHIKQIKGTDKSNIWDEEDAEAEFSDDEQEREHKSKGKRTQGSEQGEIVEKKRKKKGNNKRNEQNQSFDSYNGRAANVPYMQQQMGYPQQFMNPMMAGMNMNAPLGQGMQINPNMFPNIPLHHQQMYLQGQQQFWNTMMWNMQGNNNQYNQ